MTRTNRNRVRRACSRPHTMYMHRCRLQPPKPAGTRAQPCFHPTPSRAVAWVLDPSCPLSIYSLPRSHSSPRPPRTPPPPPPPPPSSTRRQLDISHTHKSQPIIITNGD